MTACPSCNKRMFTKQIVRFDRVDSTNARLKELAAAGAAEGTVVIADGQTAGRGTGGRSFFSPEGEGLYCSLLLRPQAEAEQLLTLTGRAAAAVREGIQRASGAPCGIKWLNDIWLNGKKLCGILAELSPDLDYVIIGIGVNLTQSRGCFAAQGLEDIATSLAAEGYPVQREHLLSCILDEMQNMYHRFPHGKADCLRSYRDHCLTFGRQVSYWENGVEREGIATGIDENFALIVAGHPVRSGTVYLK